MGSVNPPTVRVRTIALVVMVLIPYATVTLSFRTALWAQGGTIVALVGVFGLLALPTLPRRWQRVPAGIRIGLAAYSLAAVWGCVVGLWNDNPLGYVASQGASMLLLPAAFAAFLGGRDVLTPTAFVTGMGVAAAIALAVHLGALLGVGHLLPPPGEQVRLALRNEVAIGGPAVLGYLSVLGWWWSTRRPVAMVAVVGLVTLVLGTMSRGAWLAALVGTVAWAIATGAATLRAVAWFAVGLTFALAVLALTAGRIAARDEVRLVPQLATVEAADGAPDRERTYALSAEGDPEKWVPLVAELETSARGLDVDLWLRGPRGSNAVLEVEGFDGTGDSPCGRFTTTQPGRGAWERILLVKLLPCRAVSLDLSVFTSAGTWLVSAPVLRPHRGLLSTWVSAVWARVASAVTPGRTLLGDGNIAYRLREWKAVRSVWCEASTLRILTGHGLGAVFSFTNSAWDSKGQRTTLPTASYIHNYYVFLGFKLGVAGIVALLGLISIGQSLFLQRVHPDATADERWLAPAVAAALVGYSVWSITSPELLDFRVAPVLGAAIAACFSLVARPSGKAAGKQTAPGTARTPSGGRRP